MISIGDFSVFTFLALNILIVKFGRVTMANLGGS